MSFNRSFIGTLNDSPSSKSETNVNLIPSKKTSKATTDKRKKPIDESTKHKMMEELFDERSKPEDTKVQFKKEFHIGSNFRGLYYV